MIKTFLKRIPGVRSAAQLVRRGLKILKRAIRGPTQGERYDIESMEVMRRVLTAESSAIDVGANKGEILAEIVRLAPLGAALGLRADSHA